MFLTETWHDSDSVSLSRLRADGYQVVDQPRPRQSTDTLSTNYGSVTGTFELLCVRVVSGSSSCVVAGVYRPESVTVMAAFFSELSDVLDCISTFAEPVRLVGDVNIQLDRPTDADAVQFTDLLAVHGYG